MMNFLRRVKRYLARHLRGPVQYVPVRIPVLQSELLKGRKAVITGGSSGIGLAIAKAYLTNGASVVITGRDAAKLSEARKLLAADAHVETLVMDNVAPESFEAALSAIGDFDILVNNAGYVGGGVFGSTQVAEFDKVLDTNLRGAYFLSQVVANSWIKKGIKGNILNICSASSLRPGESPYILSKWGLRALTIGMAKKLIPQGIVVNGLAPGCTDTPQFCPNPEESINNPRNPTGRLVTVEEVANMAVVLVSSLARMVVGDVMYITGGGAITTLDD